MPSARTVRRVDCWSLAWKNRGKRLDRNAGFSGSEQQRPEINLVAKSHGEVLSLDESTTGKILYSVEEAHTWLLDSGATFRHLTASGSRTTPGVPAQYDWAMRRRAK